MNDKLHLISWFCLVLIVDLVVARSVESPKKRVDVKLKDADVVKDKVPDVNFLAEILPLMEQEMMAEMELAETALKSAAKTKQKQTTITEEIDGELVQRTITDIKVKNKDGSIGDVIIESDEIIGKASDHN